MFRVLRVKLQIQFSLIDAMLMGLKLSPCSTNKYITGTPNKGANRGKRVVFLGWGREGEKEREWEWESGGNGKRQGKGIGSGREGEGGG